MLDTVSEANRVTRKRLRCYAEGSHDGWEAICVDLDIAVQGDTFEEVYHSLYQAIEQYVDVVMELEDVAERERLFNRRAPLAVRLRLAWHHMLFFFAGRNKDKERHDFVAPSGLCPS